MTTTEKINAISALLNSRASYPKWLEEKNKQPRLSGSVELSVLDDKEIAYLKNLAILIIEQEVDNGTMAKKREELTKIMEEQKAKKAAEFVADAMAEKVVEPLNTDKK
jgi:hypothetical protein